MNSCHFPRLGALLSVFLAQAAWSQEPAPAPAPASANAAALATQPGAFSDLAVPQYPSGLAGSLGIGKIGEDVFLTMLLRLNFDRENWGIGFGVPLRLRLIDNDPESDYGGVIRKQDWDEPGEFLRVIRYVYLGDPSKRGPFYIRVGELSGLSVGHGTIVNRFTNGFDLNRWRMGLNLAVNVGAFGAETVVGDVAHPSDPALVGLRATVRPLQLVLGEESFWRRLVVGASVMADTNAPDTLRKTETPCTPGPDDPRCDVTGFRSDIVLSDDFHPEVATERPVVIAGVDVGFELLASSILSITPYVDFNKLNQVENGYGFHLGVLYAFRFPVLLDTLMLDLRTEYRRVSGDYVAPYFNATHEIDRYEYPPGSGVTKLAALKARGDDSGRNGVYLEALAGLPEWVFVSGEFLDYDGGRDDGQLRLSLHVPALSIVRFTGTYYRINVRGLDDLFALDDRSTLVAAVSFPLFSVFSLDARFRRIWQPDPSQGNSYQSVDDWSVGVGFAVQL